MSKSIIGGHERPAKVVEIEGLLIQGATKPLVVKWAKDHGWTETPDEIREYIGEAKEAIAARAEKNRDLEFQMAVERISLLYKAAVDADDRKTAFNCLTELNKMHGLLSATKLDVLSDTTVRAMTSEQMREEWLRLAAEIPVPALLEATTSSTIQDSPPEVQK